MSAQAGVWLAGEPLDERLGETRLADAGRPKPGRGTLVLQETNALLDDLAATCRQ